MHIWMLASENGALAGGKVGGVGDVIRDLPLALTALGHRVSVFTPSYGTFHRLPGARRQWSVRLRFGGRERRAAAYRIPVRGSSVRHFAVEHGLITAARPARIYHHDGPASPFASDAGRYAFFCAAMAALLEQTTLRIDVLHLHDWHTGLLLALRRLDDSAVRLRRMRCVFTIHNLAYQGVRPLRGHESSFESWFPGLNGDEPSIRDPRYADCINPMAAAIRLADKLNTVSPGYAREILEPSDPARGFVGGEGLESDLAEADRTGRLVGILNGCSYPGPARRRPGWTRLVRAIGDQPRLFPPGADTDAVLSALPPRRPASVLLSIGRVTEQKSALFLQETDTGRPALEALLELPRHEFVLIMLGSGDTALERRLHDIAARHDRFLFLCGYSESLAELLYAAGDLFLMPSSFEPCGISQMLAMRAGQPCVVHAVGGLRDTVVDGVTGFAFAGDSPRRQAGRFVATVDRALTRKRDDPAFWRRVCASAAAVRFTWESSAAEYVTELYDN